MGIGEKGDFLNKGAIFLVFLVGKMSICELGLVPWFNGKVVDPLVLIIRRGAEPKQLAFSTALGFTLGLFPVCGVTVLLCILAIALFGKHCNAPTVMIANFVATPVELSLLIPFLRLGEAITGSPHFPLTADALKQVLTGHATHEILLSIFHALLGWIIAAPFILGALYAVLVPAFKYLAGRFDSLPQSPRKPLLLLPEI